MTNYEYYKDEIDKIARMGRTVAFDKTNKKISSCNGIACLDCLFRDDNLKCRINAIKWAAAEYVEPAIDWSKVPIDTQILVRDIESAKWHKRHFAGVDERGRVMSWDEGRTSWSSENRKNSTVSWNYAKLAEDDTLMEFNYLREKQRMLNSIGRTGIGCIGVQCSCCPLSRDKNARHMLCVNFEIEYPDEATEVVRKWAEKHPKKTRKDVLLEKFPNAIINNGTPRPCAGALGFVDGWHSADNCSHISCKNCWDTEAAE